VPVAIFKLEDAFAGGDLALHLAQRGRLVVRMDQLDVRRARNSGTSAQNVVTAG